MRLVYFVFLLSIVTFLRAKDFKLYYLGGQSNMEGLGYVNELPEELKAPESGVYIFHGNTSPDNTEIDGRGIWAELRPGHGYGFTSDGQTNHLAERFGVELTFGRKLKELMPGENIALIKYARSGSSIDIEAAGKFGCWDPDFNQGNGINQYDHFLATVRNAFAVDDIDGDGERDHLIPAGIIWMQGESDAAFTEEIAMRYEANLKELMNLIRAALRMDDLPVAIGQITDSGQDDKDGKVWNYGYIVRTAQATFVEEDNRAALVTSTGDYQYSDRWHYDSAGYLDLGEKFAEAVWKLSDSR